MVNYTTVSVRGLPKGTVEADVVSFFTSRLPSSQPRVSNIVPNSELDVRGRLATTVTLVANHDDILKWHGSEFNARQGGTENNIHIEEEFLGVTPLARAADPEFDVYFIHGIGGHAFESWASEPDQYGNVRMWPRDFIQHSLEDDHGGPLRGRFSTVGYNSNTLNSGSATVTVERAANNLTKEIESDRPEGCTRPIYFVAHSLGGIVVCQALVASLWQQPLDRQTTNAFFHSNQCLVRGIAFFGTPFSGRQIANCAQHLVKYLDGNTTQVSDLRVRSRELANVSSRFTQVQTRHRILVITCYEKMPWKRIIISGPNSSTGVAINVKKAAVLDMDGDHKSMVKFNDRENNNYRTFATQMFRMVRSTLRRPPGGDDKSIDAGVHDLNGLGGLGMVPDPPIPATVALPLANGANREAKDEFGNTPLQQAAMKGCFADVLRLLTNGAEVEVKNKFQKTAIQQAATEGHLAVVKLLLANGADFDEIKSQNVQQATAEEYIAVLLTRNKELRPFHYQALAKMGRDNFIANYQMLLKHYHLDLSRDAVANIERSTVQLVTRLSMERLATLILNLSEPGNEHARTRMRVRLTLETANRLRDLGQWIQDGVDLILREDRKVATGNDKDGDENGSNETSEDRDDSSSIDEEDTHMADEDRNRLRNVAAMEKFLMSGSPFQGLLINLGVFVLPAALTPFTRIVMSAPRHQIWFSVEEDVSFSNRVKGFIEDHSAEPWNWWPGQRRMRSLKSNEIRMHWICSCNGHHWTELSKSHAHAYRAYLKRMGVEIQHNLCSAPRDRISMKTLLAGIFRAASSTSESRRRYQPSTTNPAPPTEGVASRPAESSSKAGSFHSGPLSHISPDEQGRREGIDMPRYIFFGVKGARLTLELAQIDVTNKEDAQFYDDLLKRYREGRGFGRYWFSVWQLGHCRFVKFKKMIPDRIIFYSIDLPTEPIYEYKPRPPEIENPPKDNPPVTKSEFECVFLSCGRRCMLSYVHDCGGMVEIGNSAVQRIPKRVSEPNWKLNTEKFAWGLEARLYVSTYRVFIVHLLMFIAPFGFWAWWQSKHPYDLQTAAVPLSCFGMFVSLFWSTAGILKMFEED